MRPPEGKVRSRLETYLLQQKAIEILAYFWALHTLAVGPCDAIRKVAVLEPCSLSTPKTHVKCINFSNPMSTFQAKLDPLDSTNYMEGVVCHYSKQ